MRSTRNLKTQVVISVFLVMLGLTAVAGGKTIYVDAGATGVNKGSWADFQFDIQYPSIQAAIDASIDGDTIILAPGTFRGDGNRDLDFKGKAITLCSTDPNDPNIVAATIIDCNGSEGHYHRGFYFHSGEDANSVVEGLTITNGFHTTGGGICCSGSSPMIRNNVITGNKIGFDWDGGGIMSQSQLKVSDDSIFYLSLPFVFLQVLCLFPSHQDTISTSIAVCNLQFV